MKEERDAEIYEEFEKKFENLKAYYNDLSD